MCDPGGSTLSRVRVDGAQRPIEGDRGLALTGRGEIDLLSTQRVHIPV